VLGRGVQPAITYTYFSMEDPVVGATRRTRSRCGARRHGVQRSEEIRVIRQGQAMPANQVVPPTVSGHNPKLPAKTIHNPAQARALLDRFGYKDRDGDGFRELPDGKPLTLTLSSAPSAIERQFDELWVRSMKEVGLRIEFNKQKWPDCSRPPARPGADVLARQHQHHAEGFGFLGLLYGGHAGFPTSRASSCRSTTGSTKRRAAWRGPARDQVMQKMGDLVNAYAPGTSTCSATRTCSSTLGRRLQVQRVQPAPCRTSTSTSTAARRRASRRDPPADAVRRRVP